MDRVTWDKTHGRRKKDTILNVEKKALQRYGYCTDSIRVSCTSAHDGSKSVAPAGWVQIQI